MLMYVLNRDEEVIHVLTDDAHADGAHFFDGVTTEKINQGTNLTFNVDATEEYTDILQEENFIVFKDLKDTFQMFVIKEVVDLHGDEHIKEIFCEYASIELIEEIILENICGTLKPEAVLAHVLKNTRWSVGSYPSVYVRDFTESLKLKTALNGVYTVADSYNLEVKFRVEFVGNKVTGRFVDLVIPEKANDVGKRFEYSKDIETIKRTVNTHDVKTALVCYGAEIQQKEGTPTEGEAPAETTEPAEEKERVSIAQLNWKASEGKPVDKPFGQIYLEDITATQVWGYANLDGSKRPRFAVAVMDKVDTPEELAKMGWLQLQKLNKPKITYEVEAIDLYALTGNPELSFELVRCGDIVTIIDHAFKPALTLKSRILEVKRDLHSPENTRITLGNFLETVVDKDIKSQLEDLKLNVSSVANNIPDIAILETDIKGLQNKVGNGIWDKVKDVNQQLFEGAIGYHYIDNEQGIWVYDSPIDQQPRKAVVLKGGQVGVAKYDLQLQKWVVGTFIDGDSVNASLINTGHLKGDLIEAGTVKLEALELSTKQKIESIEGKVDAGYVDTQISAVQGSITSTIQEFSKQVTYKVEIISTNGSIFKNGNICTTLQAKVYKGASEVTNSINADKFRWKRTSSDTEGDIAWNTSHQTGTKELAITKEDVQLRATFTCEILE